MLTSNMMARGGWPALMLASLLLWGCGDGSSADAKTTTPTVPTAPTDGGTPAVTGAMSIRGVDLSMLERVEQGGGTFQENGVSQDLIPLLASHGVNLVRLRLWVDPVSATGDVYGGGDLDLARVTRLAKRAKAAGMRLMLDLHYSDFWTDPGKQFKPKAWQNLSDDELVAKVQQYSQQVIASLITQGVQPDYVQVGNELNSGMLWPTGKNWGNGSGGFDMLASLLKAGVNGIQAAETAAGIQTRAKIILHLADGGDNGAFRWWFDEITKRKVPFDIVGISYYPYWHGALAELQSNMNDMVSRYSKPVLIVETAYAFTTDNADSLGNNFGATELTAGGYPATPVGQQTFLQDLRGALMAVPDSQGLGFVYWEPDWLPVDATWATDAGMSYINTSGNVGNAWENQALFDFNGDALPALAEFAAQK